MEGGEIWMEEHGRRLRLGLFTGRNGGGAGQGGHSGLERVFGTGQRGAPAKKPLHHPSPVAAFPGHRCRTTHHHLTSTAEHTEWNLTITHWTYRSRIPRIDSSHINQSILQLFDCFIRQVEGHGKGKEQWHPSATKNGPTSLPTSSRRRRIPSSKTISKTAVH